MDVFVYWYFSLLKELVWLKPLTSSSPLCKYAPGACLIYTVKPVLSDYIVQDLILVFKTGGRLLLHERSAESSRSAFCATLIRH